MKKQEHGMEYASARATPSLVGRKEILGIINRAIEDKSDQTQIIYITARGGMGKTRLLEEVLKHWNTANKSKSKKTTKLISVQHLIDLYHTHTHSEEGLIAEIVDALDPQSKLFTRYPKKRAELTHMKYQKGEIQPIQRLRKEMEDVFLEELNELGGKYAKIVLVFDTAEVLTYETDRVQKALGLADHPIGVARWLTQGFLNKIRNAVVLIAGRPEDTSKQLMAELTKTVSKVLEYPLPGFSEDETFEYFKVVTEAVRAENAQSAKRIESIPEQTLRAIHHLTGGEPFVLALLIDYLAIAKEIPSLTDRSPEIFREELRDLIVQTIQEDWRPLDQVVEALSWATKGMGAELLAWVLHHHEPTEEEINNAQNNIHALRQWERRLSFVKIRAADDLVFLQDEMYALMEKIHKEPNELVKRNKTYKDILAFYEWKIGQARAKIEEMERNLQLIGEITSDKLAQPEQSNIAPEEEKMRRARALLQAYQVEQVYYTLQANVLEGFRLYSQYAEESFQSRDLNLWLLLRDELLRFANKPGSQSSLPLNDIESDIGVRWIKISLADDDYMEAQRQITRFRETCADLLQAGSYADLNLKIWEAQILIYTGKQNEKAQELLHEILTKSDRLPSETSLDQWRISFLRAYAIYWQGYLYRMKGEFKQAVDKYLLGLPIWRNLNFKLEAATNLNDLSWAEAEIGAFESALVHCNDALNLRRKLGRRYLVAFSLNTLGLIETRAGAPEKARFRCEQALKIFRGMEDARGTGLACHALAESLRRITNGDLLNYEQTIDHLRLAAARAEEAVGIFSKQVLEPLRLTEAYIEVGCVYREWARHLPLRNFELLDKVEKCRAAYESAVSVAQEGGYEYRAIDALVNLAWLYYYVGDIESAKNVLRYRVRSYLGDEHLYTTAHGVDESQAPTSWNWVQLGKTNVLLGMIHFDEYKQINGLKEKNMAEQKLRQAAHNWTLSMAYNSLYGKDFRDFAKGRDKVYERLGQLNTEEMRWIVESMKQTHVNYHIAEEQRAFEQLLKNRFGLLV